MSANTAAQLAPLAVTVPPPSSRPPAQPYKVDGPALATPMLDSSLPQRFDRVAFASPKVTTSIFADRSVEPGTQLPPPDRFAATLIKQAVEALLGHRPVRQLQTWLHPAVYEAFVRRAGLGQRINGRAEKCLPPHVKKVVVCIPREGVAETSLVIFDGTKIRAAAVRLEVRRSRWHATALEII
ncbi:Rv3235 family protein [Trueperella bialowiezensis]|uniref:Uncharacterized protein n=1 Tax=Trueperella bialowiezensis TaxID=312285 RepID=A0A3S4UZN1_9ACTO|nr:Rv3235 family protein [Trueperella bialowiezensis]VEI13714.1 Uncharacterised protein [Trueperella bialowiezensis]